MTKKIVLLLIFISFFNCQFQKENKINDNKKDSVKVTTKKIIKEKPKKNAIELCTLMPLKILNPKAKNVYKKYGLSLSGSCYNCDLAKFRVENHSIFITNICDPNIELGFKIDKTFITRNKIEINTTKYSFQFIRVANEPVYELKIVNADFKNKELLISKYFTLKNELNKFEIHDCGDFDG